MAGTFLPPGLTTSDVKITSGGTNNYVMTAVDGETIQGESDLTFDGSDLTLSGNFIGDNLIKGNYYRTGNGTTSNAGYGFTNDNDTGLNLASAGIMNVMVGGVVEASFSATGLTLGGAVAADTAIIFDGNAVDYHIGLDDSHDDLVIGKGTVLGTTPIITISLAGTTEMLKVNTPAVTLAADTDFYKVRIARENVTTAPSGTTPLIAQLRVDKPAITATGTVTTSATVYIEGAATEATNDYALWVDAGVSRFDGQVFIQSGTSADPALAFYDDDDTGIYRSGGGQVGITGNTAVLAQFTPAYLDVRTDIHLNSKDINGAVQVRIGSLTASHSSTNGTNFVSLFDGTAPAGTLTNGASFFCASGEMNVIDAAGNVTLLSPHDDDGEWVFHSHDDSGKVIHIQMERMMKRLDEMLGGGFIEEYIQD
jgi:hypothetical protein